MRKKTMIAKSFIASLLVMSSLSVWAQDNSNTNAVIENILQRRSVRKFTDKKVDRNQIETLLRAAMAAPTCRDKEPWHFVVLDNKEDITAFAGNNHHSDQIKATPLVIVVCGDTTRTMPGMGKELWVQDVSAATENMLLAAHALGLGAVWTTGYPIEHKVKGISKRLNLQNNLISLAVVLIGYPGEETHARDKWDPEKVTWGIRKGKR